MFPVLSTLVYVTGKGVTLLLLPVTVFSSVIDIKLNPEAPRRAEYTSQLNVELSTLGGPTAPLSPHSL